MQQAVGGLRCGVSVVLNDGSTVEVDRGRSPDFLTWRRFDSGGTVCESGGGGRTRDEDERLRAILGIDAELFRHIGSCVAGEPAIFALGAPERRAVLGPVLAMRRFDDLADRLRERAKQLRARVRDLEVEVRAAERSRRSVEESNRHAFDRWRRRRERELAELDQLIRRLEDLDPDEEIRRHEENALLRELMDRRQELERRARGIVSERERIQRERERIRRSLERLKNDRCPKCGSALSDPDGRRERELMAALDELATDEEELACEAAKLVPAMKELDQRIERTADGGRPWSLSCSDMDEARRISQELDDARRRRTELESEEPPEPAPLPPEGPVGELEDAREELEACELLLKLCTKDESPARRAWIRRRLAAVNDAMDRYLAFLGFDGRVHILDDVGLDTWGCAAAGWGGLSRGEKVRVRIAWLLACHEAAMHDGRAPGTILLDEALDEGMDTDGLYRAWQLLVNYAARNGVLILCATNREELISAAQNVLVVERRGGVSRVDIRS